MMRKKLVTTAVALALSQSVLADNFNNTVFFGDSLTDSGAFFGNSFTTNPSPVWAEVLAESLGHSASSSVAGGTNYAQGGARVSQLPGIGGGPALGATPVATQINSYLTANGGMADANTLYGIWAGANDVFFAVSAFTDTSDILSYLSDTAVEEAQLIGGLQAAGAKHVIVANLPDIGITPDGVDAGPANSAALTQVSEYYNTVLFTALNSAGLEVIPIDMMGMLREVSASPELYGFTNTTDRLCGATSSLLCVEGVNFAPGEENTYLYADGVHPTGGAHELTADYVNSVLSAGSYVRQLSRSAIRQQQLISSNLMQQLDLNRSLNADQSAIWGALGTSRDDWSNSGFDTDSNVALNAGVIKRLDDSKLFGFGFDVRKDVQSNAGSEVENQMKSFSLLMGYQANNWSLDSQFSVGTADYDLKRQIKLGAGQRTMSADTDGFHATAAVQAHYGFQNNQLKHGPIVGLQYQRVSIDGFSESSETGDSASLSYSKLDQDSLLLKAGWKAVYEGESWKPFGQIEWVNVLDSADDNERLALVTMPTNSFSLPNVEEDDGYGQLTLGGQFNVSDSSAVTVKVDHIIGNDDMDSTQLLFSFNKKF